ncbi:MAG TPA: hypothetical protein PLW66_14370, partial [Saprospiraceae bacterium]|nr:hypothetical protein [Saprospiraceae bacterium]
VHQKSGSTVLSFFRKSTGLPCCVKSHPWKPGVALDVLIIRTVLFVGFGHNCRPCPASEPPALARYTYKRRRFIFSSFKMFIK